jgi:hypothetical protein
VKIYARGIAGTEWRALSAGEGTDKTDKLFTAVISSVTDVKPEDETEDILYQRLLDIANQASSHRDERLFPQRKENAADPSGICHAYRVYDSFFAFLLSVPKPCVGTSRCCDYDHASVLCQLRTNRFGQSL